ncbi:hypothetical protein VT84_33625 [Gemmata sp. SH-PL17]|uniref:hypothetical protein n=1 Tax=Gemmata sp. SH-PL17 TaxID=1630693 RepID=UPI00078D2E3D|nr:hypothetical protein [Gemmata sp. SH-PL17]AMV29383.1 hypothetical protein VT84_33625 [Gemmata sp. SH-PL17]
MESVPTSLSPKDWPLLPEPTELSARLDEHGRVELLVGTADEPDSPPHRLPPPSACEHCGRGRATWTCPECRTRLCDFHRQCPVCERERRGHASVDET